MWKIMVFVSKERVAKLEDVLNNYLDVLNKSEIREQIIRAFRFENPATIFKLYDKKINKIVSFIRELEEFFYAGCVYFDPKPDESAFSGLIIISRFRNLFDVATYYANKHNGRLDRFPDLSHILSGKPLKDIAKYCSPERVKELENILTNYRPDIISGYWVVEEITKAYKSEKPVTSIELYGIKTDILEKFIERLKEFFFIGQVSFDPEPLESTFSGDIYVSRFKDPFDVVMNYASKGLGLRESLADLSGFLLLGKPAKEVAQYFLKEHMKVNSIIK